MSDAVQTQSAWDTASIRKLYDPATGHLDRRVHGDEALYQLELERIFARSWNFMAHESQIPNPGDYFINYIGEDQVIVVRDDEGKVNVLLNTCRHRGNALCRAEQGNTRSFVCSYHGWNYGLDGSLIGVPGQKTYFHDKLDRSKLGLARAAQVDHYHGFYFATFDPEAPSLHDFLGDVGRTGIGMMSSNGELQVVPGIQKNVIDCNWKIAVDNLFDWYHVTCSHASADSAGLFKISDILHPKSQMIMLGEYGHGISGPGVSKEIQAQIDQMSDQERREKSSDQLRLRPKIATQILGESGVRSLGHPNIFPNLWITLGGLQMCLRLPRGPHATELWWFTMVPKMAPPEFRREFVNRAIHIFGPGGLLEQDDGENWSQSTRASRGVASRKLGHTLQMGLGQDEMLEDRNGQRYIDTQISEHGQRWHYKAWTEWMAAKDWPDLKANHSPVPLGKI